MTKPRIIDGAAVAERRRNELAKSAGPELVLGIIVATDDPATASYIRAKQAAAEAVGIGVQVTELPADATAETVIAACTTFNRDPKITGYIVQLPLPRGIDPEGIFAAVDPAKDADGLTPTNLGYLLSQQAHLIPATPKGILSLLEAYDVAVAGKVVTVIGKGRLTGMPIAAILAQREATVIHCDKRTPDLATQTKQADVLISAAGQPGLVTADMVKEGVVVIDVGTTKVGDELRGDVVFDQVAPKASAITPVPGGVGPMTVISLLENVAALSKRAQRVDTQNGR